MMSKEERIRRMEARRTDEISNVQEIIDAHLGADAPSLPIAIEIINLLHPPRWRAGESAETADFIIDTRAHKEGCCTNSDGTWSESQECDAECWCHAPVPVTPESLARDMEIPEEVVYDPRAAGTVYPSASGVRGQDYVDVGRDRILLHNVWRCEACGCMVGNQIQHDVWHSKTRSEV